MKIYIDCGAWTGDSVLEFRKHYNYDVYAFECHPDHKKNLTKLSKKHNFTFIDKAVWISDGSIPFYIGSKQRSAASTLHKSKKKKIDRENPIFIDCIDFSKWIVENFKKDQELICKMNIEGAEYNILEKMIKDDTIGYIKKLFVSWHQSKIVNISIERHNKLLKVLEKRTIILPWRFVEGQDKDPFRGI